MSAGKATPSIDKHKPPNKLINNPNCGIDAASETVKNRNRKTGLNQNLITHIFGYNDFCFLLCKNKIF